VTDTDQTDLAARVSALSWHHSIPLGDGLVTPGRAHHFADLEATFPEFEGRSVLDIGAWDGYYSFLAERSGAARVVALDHYVWGVDLWARNRYWEECKARGALPDQGRDETEYWRPELPGRRGFELAHEALGSKVEPVVADFMTADLDDLGTFDVVLFLGVLYHLREPLTALERLRLLTGGVAVIENEGIVVPRHEDDPLLRFFPGDELGGDYGNWFATSERALHAMCRAAGFGHVETVVGPPSPSSHARVRVPGVRRARSEAPARYRIVVHASP
jgi:tRNA (mo5U34)-methyltransferase